MVPNALEHRMVLARRSGAAVRRRRGLMGEVLERRGRRAEVKVSRDEIVAFEFEMAPEKDGAGPHFHKQHVDSFYVVEGELELTVAGEVVHARPGDLVHVEPGVMHSFRNARLGARALSERARARDALRRVHPADGRGRAMPAARDRPRATRLTLTAVACAGACAKCAIRAVMPSA